MTTAYAADRSARVPDVNGWWEVARNPITKVGVFDYHGSQLPGAPDPGRVYRIYRPAEELGDPEFLASLRLLPLVDEHDFLGSEAAGLLPAEAKGVHGIVGERVEFDGRMVYANLKVFSERLARMLDPANPDKKDELSLGYRCEYDWTPGVFEGRPYDVVQRRQRGNHLALVREGRMGPDVAVLDHSLDHQTLTLDSLEYRTMPDAAPDQAKEPTLAEVVAMFESIKPMLEKIAPILAGMQAAPPPAESPEDKGSEPPKDEAPAPDPPMTPDEQAAKMAAGLDAAVAKAVKAAMPAPVDSAALAKAIAQDSAIGAGLAGRLRPFVGAFDHVGMTAVEIATYGLSKLDVKTAPAGAEIAVLDAYLRGREAAPPTAAVDSRRRTVRTGGAVDAYLNPKPE